MEMCRWAAGGGREADGLRFELSDVWTMVMMATMTMVMMLIMMMMTTLFWILAICNDIVSIGKIDEIFIDGDTGGDDGDNDDLGYYSKL